MAKLGYQIRVVNLRAGPVGPDWAGLSGPAQLKSRAVTARPAKILGRNGPARPGPAEILSRAGPVMPNFISSRIFERFFKENLNFIINSFQIKHCSFKKMAEYRRNLRGILAKNGPARPAEILGLNGPAQLKFGPDRPGPAQST